MATYAKGTIQFTPVVEQINRKFAVRKKVCSVKAYGKVDIEPAHYMGAGTRTFNAAFIGAYRKNFMFYRENARMSPITQNEHQQRTAFTSGNAWANLAAKDISTLTANFAKWQTLSTNPQAHITIGSGDDAVSLYAKGYTFGGFLRAYAIRAAKLHVLPQDTNLPAVDE